MMVVDSMIFLNARAHDGTFCTVNISKVRCFIPKEDKILISTDWGEGFELTHVPDRNPEWSDEEFVAAYFNQLTDKLEGKVQG